jgi:hypothetical protein
MRDFFRHAFVIDFEIEHQSDSNQHSSPGMDGPPPQEEDFTTIPISDRLTHKNWKARVSAYESLIKTFQATASDTDPAFKPYLRDHDLLKKIAADTNAVAQEKGVECLIALVKFAGETAAKTRESVMPILVDKCFGSSRAGTRNNAVELALQYVEVENGGAGVVVRPLCLLRRHRLMLSSQTRPTFSKDWMQSNQRQSLVAFLL